MYGSKYVFPYVRAELASVNGCHVGADCHMRLACSNTQATSFFFFANLAVIKRSPPHLVGSSHLVGSDRATLSPASPPLLLLPCFVVAAKVGVSGVVERGDGIMSSSSDAAPPPSAPFGRGLRDVPLAPTHHDEHASPPLYGTPPPPTASVLDLSMKAPGKSLRSSQLCTGARVWAISLPFLPRMV